MNFGIIGAGNIAHTHALAIQAIAGCRVVAVCSRQLDSASRLATPFGAKAYDDLEAFLAHPGLDVVSVATPSGAHFDPVMAAIRAGIPVICEKPLEISTARIDQLRSEARRRKVPLGAILNRRYTPAMDALRAACAAQRFGKLTSACCQVKWFRDQAYYDSADWRGTMALDGGGALMNQGIHTVDALLLLAGPVRSVSARIATLAHERIEVEDAACAAVEFSCGALGTIEAMTCCWSNSGHPAKIQLCGTEGSAFLADESVETWDFSKSAPTDETILATLLRTPGSGLGANSPTAIGFIQHQRNFEDFIRALRARTEPATSATEARKAVALIEAIYRSASQGGTPVSPEPDPDL